MADSNKPKDIIELLKESGKWDKMSPLCQRMHYEAATSAEAGPTWVAEMEAFRKEQARIKATPDSKKRMAWIRANAKREHAELAAWHKRCDDIAKEIQGEDYDPSIYQDDDDYRPKLKR
ncbi:MAG: hypothetical protein LBR11_12260 [Deltaproteobacteria bacterium]|jgi:hypothetical protein|nr:hypothetical protein [Deltaproteobacteria bacterium]